MTDEERRCLREVLEQRAEKSALESWFAEQARYFRETAYRMTLQGKYIEAQMQAAIAEEYGRVIGEMLSSCQDDRQDL